ncbi:hypothetical protein E2P86_10475 [Sphingobacterium psychroaquaticum]|uniref:hypothetical protein n=1 Tax=Sphingobacterium psychroaquaticum TaxID=561061 RepID=UPI00106A01CF|nr:hypothetical protein [Sphingobacterium psychroaquaticum]QBQ41550.1 hypothetical protein E2P86_10475 [Sphingobacterium psychroaquaticum]
MFRKLIFLDNQQIGAIDFQAYIIELKGQKTAFALFMNQLQTPLICYSIGTKNQVHFAIDDEQFSWIVRNSLIDPQEKSEIYKKFDVFVRQVEVQAANYFFREAQMKYFSSSDLLARYGQCYIESKESLT